MNRITKIFTKEEVDGMTKDQASVVLLSYQEALANWDKTISDNPAVVPPFVSETVILAVADKDNFFRFTCPCGVMAVFPLNGVPEKDTRHPCGNPYHWTVRYAQ